MHWTMLKSCEFENRGDPLINRQKNNLKQRAFDVLREKAQRYRCSSFAAEQRR